MGLKGIGLVFDFVFTVYFELDSQVGDEAETVESISRET